MSHVGRVNPHSPTSQVSPRSRSPLPQVGVDHSSSGHSTVAHSACCSSSVPGASRHPELNPGPTAAVLDGSDASVGVELREEEALVRVWDDVT